MRRFLTSTTARTNLGVGVIFSLLIAVMPLLMRTFGIDLFYALQILQYPPWFFWFSSLNRLLAIRDSAKVLANAKLLAFLSFLTLMVFFVFQFVIALNVYMVASGSRAVSPSVALMAMITCVILSATFSILKSVQLSMQLDSKHKLLDSMILLFGSTGLPILVCFLCALGGAPSSSGVWIWYGAQASGCLLLFIYLVVFESWLSHL